MYKPLLFVGIGAFIASYAIRIRSEALPSTGAPRASSAMVLETALEGATLLHTGSSRDTIVVFSDYQCPACKMLEEYQAQDPEATESTVFLQHLPLDRIHPRARWASALALCAHGELSSEQAHQRLFALQDSIGKVSWGTLALKIGVTDTSQTISCMKSDTTLDKIKTSVALADSLGFVGTPVVVSRTLIKYGVIKDSQRRR